MGNGGCAYAAIAAPCTAIENTCNRRQQNTAPVEEPCTLVEVGQPKKNGCKNQRGISPHIPFKEVLKPSPKEELFRNSDKEESEQPRPGNRRQSGPTGMQVQKSQSQSHRQRNRRIQGQFAQPSCKIPDAQPQVEAGSLKLPHGYESVNPRVKQRYFVEDGQVSRPCALKPAQ